MAVLGAGTLTPLFSHGLGLTVASVNSWIQCTIVCSRSPASLLPLKASSVTSLPPSSQDRSGHKGRMFQFPCRVVGLPFTPCSERLGNFYFPKLLTRNDLAECGLGVDALLKEHKSTWPCDFLPCVKREQGSFSKAAVQAKSGKEMKNNQKRGRLR